MFILYTVCTLTLQPEGYYYMCCSVLELQLQLDTEKEEKALLLKKLEEVQVTLVPRVSLCSNLTQQQCTK